MQMNERQGTTRSCGTAHGVNERNTTHHTLVGNSILPESYMCTREPVCVGCNFKVLRYNFAALVVAVCVRGVVTDEEKPEKNVVCMRIVGCNHETIELKQLFQLVQFLPRGADAEFELKF